MSETTPYNPDTNEPSKQQVNFFVPADNKHGLQPSHESEERRLGTLRHLEKQRQQILDRFTPETEGLNMNRVNAFIEGLGLRLTPNIPIDASKEPEVNELLDEIGLQRTLDGQGLYMAEPNVSFVFRDKEAERQISPEFTESLIIHELAHGSAEYNDATAHVDGQMISISVPRTGQQVSVDDLVSGTFLEEAFCEAVRGKYITEVLGHKTGLSNLSVETVFVGSSPEAPIVPLHTKYETQYENGSFHVSYSSYAGQAIDMLSEADEYLFPAMLKARKDPDGLREVAARLDKIKPGLYVELRDNFNDSDSFVYGLKHVADILEERHNK